MTSEEGVQLVHELEPDLPPGWRWRPQWVENGEALRLLERYSDWELPESAREEVKKSALEIVARCISPTDGTESRTTGLVVGYVQSGKTLSFTTVCGTRARQRLSADHHSLRDERRTYIAKQ